MLYAYATIAEQIPYGNFTPSVAADIPALIEFAERNKVPLAGKDGKTGQTMIKTALAPALKNAGIESRRLVFDEYLRQPRRTYIEPRGFARVKNQNKRLGFGRHFGL